MKLCDGFYTIPILPKEMREQVKRLPSEKSAWPKAFLADYKKRHAEFSASKSKFMTLARKDRDIRMTGSEKTVLGHLVDCLNFDTGRCDPSLQTIADETGISLRTARRAVRNLRNAGWITVYRRGKTTTNFYQLAAASEKVNAILDDSDARRTVRRSAFEASILSKSERPSVREELGEDGPRVAGHEGPRKDARERPQKAHKPLKGTSEDEPLNESSSDHGREGTYKGEAYSSSDAEEKTSATIITPDFTRKRIA